MPLVRLLAATLMAASLQCAAAPFAVQVGEARLGLDAPPGFSDTGFTGSPRLQELAESLTSASNRILLFAITDADMRKFMAGDTPEFRRYLVAVTPKELERERITRQNFGAFAAGSLRELGEPVQAGKTITQALDGQPPGKPGLLGDLRRDPEVVSVLVGSRLVSGSRLQEKTQYFVSTTTLMLVRGKALNLSIYSGYDGPPDLDWIRAITARWIDDLQRLNNR